MNETTTNQAVATTTPKPPVAFSERGIKIDNFENLQRFALCISESGLAPKGVQTPAAICVAIQMGAELGLPPMAALQNIAVINGRPTVWGDAQLGIVRSSGLLAEFSEWYEFNGQRLPRNPVKIDRGLVAVCRVKRQCGEPSEYGFSVDDAMQAGLWGKDGPWKQYPARMLRYRARAFNLRDQFGDVLRGLYSAEELQDGIDALPVATQAAPPVTITTPSPTPPDSISAESEVRPTRTAPVDQPPAAEAKPVSKPTTDQGKLCDRVIASGHSFDDYIRAIVHLRLLAPAEADKYSTFDELPAATARRHVLAIAPIIEAMNADAPKGELL
jgi:hypothetical protein